MLFDWVLCCVPFGIAEIFQAFSNSMKWTTPLKANKDNVGVIICACVRKKNEIPNWEKWRINSNGDHLITETKIENQRYVIIASKWKDPFLPHDPPHFTDITGRIPWKPHEPTPHFNSISNWVPETATNITDNSGWLYSRDFDSWGTWSNSKRKIDSTRIRYLTKTHHMANTNGKNIAKVMSFTNKDLMAKGDSLVNKIQHGIKISLLKNRIPNDFNFRTYFYLLDANGQQYQFQDYAPNTFAAIRSIYGIDEYEYYKTLCVEEILGGEVEVAGKSGQIFWRSLQNDLIIKTVTQEEAYFLQHALESYLNYLTENPHTLISRFFGLHKIKVDNTRIRFVIMNNVFSTSTSPIQLIYDLKGTTEDRLVKHDAKAKIRPVLKDLNFRDRYVLVTNEMVKALHEQITRDSKFFYKIGVMDYSLLLGVSISEDTSNNHSPTPSLNFSTPLQYSKVSKSKLSKTSIFENGIKGILGETYYLGIIDILQNWTCAKQLANSYKTLRFFDFKQKKIDSVSPEIYSKRFINYFINKIKDIKTFGSESFVKEEYNYKFVVKCTCATDLPTTEVLGRKCNPYVVIECDNHQSVTSVVKSNLNPVWSHLCSFPIVKKKIPKEITFTVWNWDFGFMPDFLGMAILNTDEFFKKSPQKFVFKLMSQERVKKLLLEERKTRNKSILNYERISLSDNKGKIQISIELVNVKLGTESRITSYLVHSEM